MPDAPDEEARELVHSSQLDERLRRGDPDATPQDRRRRVGFDLLLLLGFLTLVIVPLGHVGIGIQLGIGPLTIILALAAGILAAASFVFTTIRWRALRKPQGLHVLDKARTDLLLTIVSIAALFTVVIMVVIEIVALLVFIGALPNVGKNAARFADNFILFQTIMLLIYVGALVVRELHPSSYRPTERALAAARFLSPVAGVAVLAGVALATGAPQSVGILTSIEVHQAVYVVTLGVLLEFMAMRIRMRLPSLWSRFKEAVDASRRANEEMRTVLQKRALRTYLISLLFVAGSMAFAGAIASGNVIVDSTRARLSLVIFYVGMSLIFLGVITVRVLQGRQLKDEDAPDELGIDELLARKRRPAEEIFRMAVYAVTGSIAAVAVVLSIMTGMGNMGWHEKYATDLFLLALIFAAGPYGWFFNRELARIEAIDDKFPDFLRDIAESGRAGMTLPRALVTAANGTYGHLTPEIKRMAAQVEWGVEFADALGRFAQRADTPLIHRTVNLVVEAQRAGGNVVDILTAASDDAREIKQIVSERNEQMKMYKVVVYIAFFVFIAVVMVLSAQFIPAFEDAVGAASGQQVGGIQFKDFDPEDFNTLFFHAAVVQAIGGGLVGGVLTRGRPVAGFGSIAVMIIAAWVSFRIVVGLMQ